MVFHQLRSLVDIGECGSQEDWIGIAAISGVDNEKSQKAKNKEDDIFRCVAAKKMMFW